MKSVKYEEIGD